MNDRRRIGERCYVTRIWAVDAFITLTVIRAGISNDFSVNSLVINVDRFKLRYNCVINLKKT